MGNDTSNNCTSLLSCYGNERLQNGEPDKNALSVDAQQKQDLFSANRRKVVRQTTGPMKKSRPQSQLRFGNINKDAAAGLNQSISLKSIQNKASRLIYSHAFNSDDDQLERKDLKINKFKVQSMPFDQNKQSQLNPLLEEKFDSILEESKEGLPIGELYNDHKKLKMSLFDTRRVNKSSSERYSDFTTGHSDLIHFKIPDFIQMHDYASLDKHFQFLEISGQGAYGKVYKAIHNETKIKRALKLIKTHDNQNQPIEKSKQVRILKSAKNEWKTLEMLDHPNIVRCLDVYQGQENDQEQFTIVSEYIGGRDLFDETIKRERFSERDAAKVLKQILLAVNYCHQKEITHRDIKAENILMTSQDNSDPIEIKLIDFGLACPFNSPENKNKVVGTMLYMSPEILKRQSPYDGKSDMWAIGIVFYMMITGCIPYIEKDMGRLADTIRQGNYDKGTLRIVKPSQLAISLLEGLLNKHPNQRLTALEALNHPWIEFLGGGRGHYPLEETQLLQRNLICFKPEYKLQEAMLVLIIHKGFINQPTALQTEIFREIDEDFDGLISHAELLKALQTWSSDKYDSQIANVMSLIDLNKNGFIDYTEWMIATTDWASVFLDNKVLINAFNYLDRDKTGVIREIELCQVFQQKEDVFPAAWRGLLVQINTETDGPGQINFQQFQQMMLQGLVDESKSMKELPDQPTTFNGTFVYSSPLNYIPSVQK